MKMDLVVLDIDGVMVDVTHSYREAIIQTVKTITKKSISNDDINAVKKMPGSNNDWDVSFALSYGIQDFSKINRASPEYIKVKDTFQSIYQSQKLYDKEKMLVKEETLAALAQGAKLSIVTSRPRKEALYAMRSFIPKFFNERLIVALEDCKMEKPNPEPLLMLKERTNAKKILYVGDTINDALCAEAAGAAFVSVVSEVKADFFIDNVNETPKLFSFRAATLLRETKETRIFGVLNLDGTGNADIQTSVGFFDHMLNAFTKHGLFDLKLIVKGDLYVDEHHTIEDVGIVLGRLFREALGEKKGIGRYGFFLLPMDEALAQAAIDLDGRGTLTFRASFRRKKIGDLETELIQEFFEAFARECGCALQLKILEGRNEHHKIEAMFKAFARALRMACEIDKRQNNKIPSTKGEI